MKLTDRVVVLLVRLYLGSLRSPGRIIRMTDDITVAIIQAVKRTGSQCSAAAEAESDVRRAQLARIEFEEMTAADSLRQ